MSFFHLMVLVVTGLLLIMDHTASWRSLLILVCAVIVIAFFMPAVSSILVGGGPARDGSGQVMCDAQGHPYYTMDFIKRDTATVSAVTGEDTIYACGALILAALLRYLIAVACYFILPRFRRVTNTSP